ncbi:MAG: hypothetical protein IKX96_01370 [Firmicutes bacterium]|nr:hypothetical protein [Bacillota bacterium]
MKIIIRKMAVISLAALTMVSAFPGAVHADELRGRTIMQEQIKPDPGGFSTTQGLFCTTTVKVVSKVVLHGTSARFNRRADHDVQSFSRRLQNSKRKVHFQNKLDKALARQNSSTYKRQIVGNNMLKYGDKLVSGYSIYKTGESYLESKHTHSSMRFLSRTIKGFDMGMNAADIAGAKGAGGVAIVSGYTKDIFESDEVAWWMNQQDNDFLRFADDQMDLIDDYWTKQFYDWFFRPAEGVGVYKPNIYIYPDEEADVTVKFAIPGLLTNVIPDYTEFWSVTAAPSGKLTDANGARYDYLFYEMDIQPQLVPLNNAFLVPADSRTEVFTEMLKGYGLNDKEIADFCEFWTDKLESGKTYLAYEILTEDVDALMPIEIGPQPDSVLRLWFCFVEYEGQDFVQAQPAAFTRDGFTVVEWGGILN